jgi:hypothetical protein
MRVFIKVFITILITMLITILISTKYNVIFISQIETDTILQNNHSFYDRFHTHDLHARRVSSINEYLEKIKESPSFFTVSEKLKLLICITIANYRLSRIDEEWFDGKKAAYGIVWKIGCVKGFAYEDALPHTVDDNIILSHSLLCDLSYSDLVGTLMHEKTHVYQKVYDSSSYLSTHGFTKLKKTEMEDTIRVNPDTDNYLYTKKDKDTNQQHLYKLTYRTKTPSSITDTTKPSTENEHPLEEMAYIIENM